MPKITLTENWKPIEGYEGLYEVSDLSRVRSLFNDIILKPVLTSNGKRKARYRLTLCRNCEKHQVYVHRVVAKAWVAGWFEGAIVNHLDNDPLNNLPANLEWTTHKGNTAHAFAIGACSNRQNQYTKRKQSKAA